MPGDLQKWFWPWFWAVNIFAVGPLIWAARHLSGLDWGSYLVFVGIGIAAQYWSVAISAQHRFSVLFVVDLAILLVFGLPASIINTLVGMISDAILRKRAWYKNVYNLATTTLDTVIPGWLLQVITQTPLTDGLFSHGGEVVSSVKIGSFILPLLLVILLKYFVNGFLMAMGKALASGDSPFKLWFEEYYEILPVYVPMAFIGVVMAQTYSIGGIFNVLAVAVPLLLARYAFFLLSQARESELRIAAELQNVLDGIPAAIVAADLAGKVTTFNRMAGKLTGLTPEEAIGRPLRELPVVSGLRAALGEDRGEPVTIPEAAVSEATFPEAAMLEATLPQAKGAAIPILARFVPFNDRKGNRRGQLLIFWDITAEKQLEAARLDVAKLTAFNQVAAALTHEMKNPLTIIRGYAEHLAETRPGDPDGREALGIIMGEADRLTAILEEVLDAARPEASPPVPVNLRDFLEKVGSLMKAQCARAGVSLEFAFDQGDPHLDPCVKAAEDKLQRVFTNLFFNSLDAMPNGGKIRVSTRLPDHARWVEIRVEDNGKGIRASDLPRVFDPFFSTKKHGTGLGLTNCAQIIRGYGGTIALESREGEGTTVSIRLPVHRT